MGKLIIWFRELSFVAKAAVVAVAFVSYAVVSNIAVPAPAQPTPVPNPSASTAIPEKSPVVGLETAPTKPSPKIEVKTETVTQAIAFKTTTIEDGTILKGQTAVKVAGVNGEKALTYKVTYTDGTETERKLISEAISKQPVGEIVYVGTRVAVAPQPQASSCDPNYSGCVPIASDVDCAGGSGNGPAYVQGPVRVVGADIYDLDRDGDGIACDQ